MPELVHPDLPGRVIDVPEKGIPARARHGWVRKSDAPSKPAESAPKDDWIAYAESLGDDDLDVTKQELIARHG